MPGISVCSIVHYVRLPKRAAIYSRVYESVKGGIEWNQRLMETSYGLEEFENEPILCLCDMSLAALIQPGRQIL